MMHVQSLSKTSDSLIPDCCNLGVLLRVLVSINFIVLMGLLSRGDAWQLQLQNFIETAMLVESVTLSSLLLLCGVRRFHLLHPINEWLQRLLCGFTPCFIMYCLLNLIGDMEWFVLSFPRINLVFSMLFCFASGIGFQQYFELRMKAYSPALGEARLQALQARIRPHFLFNSLNTVLSLIRTEPGRAETMLEDLADLFRVLMRDTRNMTSLREEIHLCKQYLSIEKSRLGERLQVDWKINKLTAEEMQQIEIPALLLQPLIENAVHYGIEPSVEVATVLIEIKKNIDKIAISITNPYHASYQAHSGNQMALENIRQRLALLYDIEAQINYGVVGNTFEVKLYFPGRR